MKISVNFRFVGFVGSERKNISHKRVDKPLYGVIVVEEKLAASGQKAPFHSLY